MSDEKALIAQLKKERQALVDALKSEKKNVKAANMRAEQAEQSAKRKIKKLDQREREVYALENEAKARFAIELKELKLFSDRIKRFAESGETVLKKSELIDLYKDFLGEIGADNAAEKAKKVSEIIKFDEDEAFDLDDILSPKGDLDLQKLCEDLGVYQGE